MRRTELIQLLLRLPASPLRALPDFIIIGAQKSGTTSLYNYLIQHPAVIPALRKETHFFDLHFRLGTLFYRAFFPLRVAMSGRMTGEATPYYLVYHHAAPRIRATVPGAKLIVVLRNPVERAYSHYQHSVRDGVEPLAFAEALQHEEARLRGEIERLRVNPRYRSARHAHYSYQSRGIYADQLQAWFAVFPREQFLILSNDDLKRDTAGVFRQTLEFLGLDPWELPEYKQHYTFSYPEMDPTIRQELADYFAPHNRRLYELLGRDLGWDC